MHWLEDSVLPWNYSGRMYLALVGEAQEYVASLGESLGVAYEDRVFSAITQEGTPIYPPGHPVWTSLRFSKGIEVSN